MSSHISKHNNKILKQHSQVSQQQNLSNKELLERGIPHCNCRNKAEYFMPDQCINSNMVYRYTVKRSDTNTTETYTGCTVGFKERHKTHMKQSEDDSNGSTTLSSHIKSLRSRSIPHDIQWVCHERATSFNIVAGWCRLCTFEKFCILFQAEGASLNQRSEFFPTAFTKTVNKKNLT